MSERDVPMIPKHQAESILMHMSWAIRCIVIVSVGAFVTLLLMASIFVSGYTSRTKDWLNTYQTLKSSPSITEVANEKEETSSVQQYPFQ